MARKASPEKGKATRIKAAAASVFTPDGKGMAPDSKAPPEPKAEKIKPATREQEKSAPAGVAVQTGPDPAASAAGEREKAKKPFAAFAPASFLKGWENLWKDNILLKDLIKTGTFMFPEAMQSPFSPPAAAPWGKCLAGFDPAALFKSMEAAWQGNAALKDAWEYLEDTIQRSILFWDVMRRRGDNFLEHVKEGEPPVLQFRYETLIDGRKLENPVNYALLKIIPEAGMTIDPRKRPFVIVDPRAGHGPGIGGSKHDSQVGVALEAGHPVYFVMFFPRPEPGQTLRDVGQAEALFLKEVIRRHPEAERPCVIGNCQAGWAVASLAAMEPDLMGTIILNGAPMSYWAGNKNKNPMRYTGGLLGGKWLTTMTCDLGNGKFDGAYLVANFENLNPANTYFRKEYNLYANIDKEAERYLNFEKWWSGFFLMNAEEIDGIVTNLFIGNRLAKGGVVLPDGRRIDLRNIKCPIVIFASQGDNITPPQQALNWIVDVYGSDEAILKEGQTIVYTLHDNVGHLGIFVGGSIAKKQHQEFVNTLEMIDGLPPGLYEMIIEKKSPFTEHAELIPGEYVARFEMRKIADIMAMNDSRRDEDYFSSVAEVSEYNDRLYRQFLSPLVRLLTTEQSAEILRWLNPSRMKYYLFSERFNPAMTLFRIWAERVRKNRRIVREDNYFAAVERDTAQTIEDALDAYRELRDDIYRNIFKAMYGPLGLANLFPGKQASIMEKENAAQEAAIRAKVAELQDRMEQGGFQEALIRLVMAAMIHLGMIDYRSSLIAKRLAAQHPEAKANAAAWRAMIRDQYFMLLIDEDRAIASLAKLLPTREERERCVAMMMEVMMISDARIDPRSRLAVKVAKALDLKLT